LKDCGVSLSLKKINGTGNSDTLTGSAGADAIYGLGGNDSLFGLAGNDLLDGGHGMDRMEGGDGNDTYVVDKTTDRVIELADAGIDTVLSSARLTVLRANVENLTFTNSATHTGVGNSLANVITGGDGRDNLVGRSGDDTLSGGGGNDNLSGANGNDQMFGGSGKDLLNGGSGNDFLDGGLNADRMSGGKGNDIYIVDNIADKVYEVPGLGTDEVRSSVNFKLGAYVENLTLTGSYSSNGTGNAFRNDLVGNGQNNVLNGLGGVDTLDGKQGNDTLIGGSGADKFVFSTALSVSSNTDLITDFVHEDGDRFALSQSIFSSFDALDRITPDAFYAAPGATHAQDAGQFLIYNTTTGALYYDADGPDGRGPIEFAQMGALVHPELRYADFLIIA
jgi:Ca2+-binding RTX toxin-like protein